MLETDAVQVPWNGVSERVRIPYLAASIQFPIQGVFEESGCLGMQPKMGGKFHLKLNMGTRPIANKYREGKMKSTLKRELKAREAVKMETIKVSSARQAISPSRFCRAVADEVVKGPYQLLNASEVEVDALVWWYNKSASVWRLG